MGVYGAIRPKSKKKKIPDHGREVQRLYLKLGDHVIHRRYPEWGQGVVVEERTSQLSGGFAMVRIVFKDGKERSFINNLDDQNCCYYKGVQIF